MRDGSVGRRGVEAPIPLLGALLLARIGAGSIVSWTAPQAFDGSIDLVDCTKRALRFLRHAFGQTNSIAEQAHDWTNLDDG